MNATQPDLAHLLRHGSYASYLAARATVSPTPTAVRCTQRALNKVLNTIREVGYIGLDRHEREVANAYDAGTLVLIEPNDRPYNVMHSPGCPPTVYV